MNEATQPKMPWFRFYSETINDRKIARIAVLTNQPKALVVGVWATVLALANDSPRRGTLMIAQGQWLTLDEIQAETGLDSVTFDNIMAGFMDMGMIHDASPNHKGHLVVTNFHRRNFKSDSSTERVRKYRARNGNGSSEDVADDATETTEEQEGDDAGALPESSSNGEGNAPDTDTDTETDPDQELTDGGAVQDFPPTTFDGWLKLVQASNNRQATLRNMFTCLFPGRDPPGFGYLAKTAKQVGGAGRLAELLWQVSARPPTGDVLRYVQAVAKAQPRQPMKRGAHSEHEWEGEAEEAKATAAQVEKEGREYGEEPLDPKTFFEEDG